MFLAIRVPTSLWLIIFINLWGHRSDRIGRPPHQSGPSSVSCPGYGSAVLLTTVHGRPWGRGPGTEFSLGLGASAAEAGGAGTGRLGLPLLGLRARLRGLPRGERAQRRSPGWQPARSHPAGTCSRHSVPQMWWLE